MPPSDLPSDPFRQLVAIMAQLRQPGGCPWDREQTHASLKQYLLEEAHEVQRAIDRADTAELVKELGDLALQVVFHAQLAAEEGSFTIDDVMSGICRKLIHRHPHVFGEASVADSAEVLANWERLKVEESTASASDSSILDGVPGTLPALHRAQRVQEKAANVGFDWKSAQDAFTKVEEEIRELKLAVSCGDNPRQAEEFGDLLFSIVNVARLMGFHTEELLQNAVDKFQARFRAIESSARKTGTPLEQMTLEQMDQVWNDAKKTHQRTQ
jgi:tetrapyrrole methylase family protein/MazG family protein